MLELENQLLTLKKGNMLVDEYTNALQDGVCFATGTQRAYKNQ